MEYYEIVCHGDHLIFDFGQPLYSECSSIQLVFYIFKSLKGKVGSLWFGFKVFNRGKN